MKYIAIYHANLNYSGLEESRYEFVIRESYERILDMYNDELKGIPFCFEASGYTLDKMQEICPDVVEKLKSAVDSGQCEVIGSPYPHIMLPNFAYEDGVATLEFTQEAYDRVLGVVPETGWNPENGWRQDIPDMYKAAGYRNLILDWDSFLISSYPDVREIETKNKGPYGHNNPYATVDPDDPTLHHPVKIRDGLTGIFRTDRCSNRILFYIMAAMKDHPLYSTNVDAASKQGHEATLQEILDTMKHWSGTKREGFLLTYADDAEYIGTSGYFFVKYHHRDELFLANPSHQRVIDMVRGINAMGDGYLTVADAIRQTPVLKDVDVKIDDDMAWHRTRASAWAQTPTSLEWDPEIRDLSERLTAVEQSLNGSEPDLELKAAIRKARFAIVCSENSDGRWPPPPMKPGAFNIEYCLKYLQEARHLVPKVEQAAAE